MRLIDADVLKNYMAEKYVMYDHTFDDIDAQPTIEPKKGEWIYKTQNVKGGKGQTYGKWQCSCCKKKEPRRRDYCPNCGARMDVADKDVGKMEKGEK